MGIGGDGEYGSIFLPFSRILFLDLRTSDSGLLTPMPKTRTFAKIPLGVLS